MFTVPSDSFSGLRDGKISESYGGRLVRKTLTLALTSSFCYPLYRGWVAYVSQIEYARQEVGSSKVPWMGSRYRGWSEAMWKLAQTGGWFRGVLPFIAMGPIVTFAGGCRMQMKRAHPDDGTLPTMGTRFLISAVAATVCELVCFPLRLAYVIMASEPHTVVRPRPTTSQVLTDLFKYGPRNKALRLAFVPGLLASIMATSSPGKARDGISLSIAAYAMNIIAIRMIIAATPGAPSPYTSYGQVLSTHFGRGSSPRIWMIGFISFFIPVITFAYCRVQLDNAYLAIRNRFIKKSDE